jgi:predicted DNA-binding transcriptional regulator YafY
VRCVICYQSVSDTQPRSRTVDPIRLENTSESVYLLAYDVSASGQEPHRYRVDRISHVTYTDDSIEKHDMQAPSLDESLKLKGELTCVSMPVEQADQLGWLGIVKRENRNGRAYLTVAVASRAWLFDQVASHAGSMRIENNPALAAELVSYAQTLAVC